ncbi:hypothetical protein [Peptoniphilus timonensis]|uniref:hypothetical protein n=1 Tax=Peptoniphilus timonensis TaxID=1268254 RepID=UPI0003179D9A|nr:hypothetical protein [Peptoniphilus timonensis]
MRKIAVLGKCGAGKDTFSDYLVNKHNFEKIYFAEPLYEICEKYFGMKSKNRELLQDVGGAMRGVNPKVFVNILENKIKELEKDYDIVVSDVRQLNEFQMLEDNIKINEEYIERMENNIAETGCNEVLKNNKDIILINNDKNKDEFYKRINENIINALK